MNVTSCKYGVALAAGVLLSACGSGHNTPLTSVNPTDSVSTTTAAATSSSSAIRSGHAVSAIYQGDADRITLDDVGILLAATREGIGPRSLPSAASNLLGKTISAAVVTSAPSPSNSNFSTKSLVSGTELDVLDVGVLYSAYVLGLDGTPEVIDGAIDSLLEGTVTNPIGTGLLDPTDIDLDALPSLISQLWTSASHSCGNSRTSDLHFDDRNTGYLGCGESSSGGTGLFKTEDGGLTWNRTSDPDGFLDTFRINSISRSSDGLLYVAGIGGGLGVVSVDTSSGNELARVFELGSTISFGFTVGRFRRNADGFAIAEADGSQIVFRRGDSNDAVGSWINGETWDDIFAPREGLNITDMVEFGGSFYASGSRISQPPQAYLPPRGNELLFEAVQLNQGSFSPYDGEMFGIAVDAEGIAIGGVNQDADVGYVYASNTDPYNPNDWTEYRLTDLFPKEPSSSTNATWVEGICKSAGRIVAVGRFSSRLNDGFVIVSTDNAQTFEDITPPEGIGDLFECEAFDNGDIVVAGSGGFVGVYTSPE